MPPHVPAPPALPSDGPGSPVLPLVALFAALLLGASLSAYRYLDPDEGRNGEIAREMMLSNDYLVPHLNGLPYLDKPIVYFAAAAAAMEVLGPTERAARLPAWLFTLVSLVLVGRWARRRWGATAGWLAALALATMPLVSGYSDRHLRQRPRGLRRRRHPVALGRPTRAGLGRDGRRSPREGPDCVHHPIACRRPGVPRDRPRSATAVPACGPRRVLRGDAAVVHRRLAAAPRVPGYVFVHETFQRVTTGRVHRTAPPWFYLPILLVGTFPWIAPALARVRRWRETWQARRADPVAADAVLLASWVLVPLAFLTLNQSKLPQYLLPLFPAVALAAAANLTRHGPRLAWRPAAAFLALLGIALVTLPWWLPPPLRMTPETRAAIPRTALTLGVVAVVAGVLLAAAARRARPTLAAIAYGLPVLAVPFISTDLMRAVGNKPHIITPFTAV